MLAEIISNERDAADVLFLLAAIAFVLAVVGSFGTNALTRFERVFGFVGLALLSVGFLVL